MFSGVERKEDKRESFSESGRLTAEEEEEYLTEGDPQSALTSFERGSFSPDVNPPTHLNNTHPVLLFHIL